MSYQFILSIEANIDEKILKNKSIILYQNKEIQKSKTSLLELQNCLINQNKALYIFREEERDLELEIEKRLNSSKIDDIQRKDIKEKSDRARALKRENPADTRGPENLKMIQTTVPQKPRLETEKNGKTKINGNVNRPYLCVSMPEFRGRVIYKIFCYTDSIICGSKGLLVRRTDNMSHTYEIDNDSVIIHMRVLDDKHVVIFTVNKIYVYDATEHVPLKVIDVLGIKYVFNNNGVTYVILGDGSVKRLDSVTWQLKHYMVLVDKEVRRIFPIYISIENAFVILKESKIYTTSSWQMLTHLKIIEGVTNIKNILIVKKGHSLCWSENTLWLMNRNMVVRDLVTFACGIKFVDRVLGNSVVVDMDNTVHFHLISNAGFRKLDERKFKRNITALGVVMEKVHIAVGDEVAVIRNTFSF